MKNPDMSPKAVFERLRLASELRDLCLELGRSKKAEPQFEQRCRLYTTKVCFLRPQSVAR